MNAEFDTLVQQAYLKTLDTHTVEIARQIASYMFKGDTENAHIMLAVLTKRTCNLENDMAILQESNKELEDMVAEGAFEKSMRELDLL